MGQYERVQKVLTDTREPLALHQIRVAILHEFDKSDSEAAISARIRDIRHDLEHNETGTVWSERVDGKSYYRYRVVMHAL